MKTSKPKPAVKKDPKFNWIVRGDSVTLMKPTKTELISFRVRQAGSCCGHKEIQGVTFWDHLRGEEEERLFIESLDEFFSDKLFKVPYMNRSMLLSYFCPKPGIKTQDLFVNYLKERCYATVIPFPNSVHQNRICNGYFITIRDRKVIKNEDSHLGCGDNNLPEREPVQQEKPAVLRRAKRAST